jgi:aldose 1-epimerase
MDISGLTNESAFNIKEWGAPDVYLIEFANRNGVSVSVSNYGAAIVSCSVPDSFGKSADIVCGYDHLTDYEEDRFYIGTVVGRYANRIKDARVMILGKELNLTATPRGFHHHGGAQGFNKKIFTPRIIESGSRKGVGLSYISADGEEGFPGNLTLTVTYMLDEDNNLSVEYEATTDKPTILNLTQHSYFNLAGHDSGPIENQLLQIMADKYLVVDDNFIPTGEIKNVEGTVFDFRRSLRLSERIEAPEFAAGRGYDNSWVLETVHSDRLKHVAEAKDEGSGRVLNVYTTEPSVHFYSGNFIDDGTRGKNGAVYNRRSGFCLETQHFPDSPHHEHFPSTLLLPGEKFFSTTIFNFSAWRGPAAPLSAERATKL